MMITTNNNTPRVCKICHKRFSSGKAMGGHMRSHLPKPSPTPNPYTNRPNPAPFSSSSYSYPRMHKHHHRHEVTRSKHRSSVAFDHILSVEEGALILMNMSRGLLSGTTQDRVPHIIDMESNEDENDDGDQSRGVICEPARSTTLAKQGKYKCEICLKRFTSYQALGGHMASHTKMKGVVIKEDDEDEDDDGYNNYGDVSEAKGFKCSYCEKVLGSSEALEVHKKIHYYYDLENINSTKTITNNSIDLNSPAVKEDDNDHYYEFGSSNFGADY